MAQATQAPATPLEGAELAAWLAQVAEWHAPPAGEVETFAEPPSLVPRTATPLYGCELADMFEEGHRIARGRPIGSKRMAECALSIIGLENANGRAIIQYNWGNVSCTPATWAGPMWQHPTPQTGQPLYFRAYGSHEEGCAAWWRLMYRGAHRRALEWAARGRPDLMVSALYASHYVVGGSQSAYRRNCCLFSEQYRREGLFGLCPSYHWGHWGRGDVVFCAAGLAGTVTMTGLLVSRWLEGRRAR